MTLKPPALLVFDKVDDSMHKCWLAKLEKHAEFLHWSDREKLLQFELHLTRKVKNVYGNFTTGGESHIRPRSSEALGKHIQPAKREALTSAQLLRRRQRPGEGVHDYVRGI